MKDQWARIARDIWSLGFESSSVVALRMAVIAAGGTHAKAEVDRMVDEKVKALIALQALFTAGALGLSSPHIAVKSVQHYRKAVRANRRRLLGSTTAMGK